MRKKNIYEHPQKRIKKKEKKKEENWKHPEKDPHMHLKKIKNKKNKKSQKVQKSNFVEGIFV